MFRVKKDLAILVVVALGVLSCQDNQGNKEGGGEELAGAPPRTCGCESMTLKTRGNASLGDDRRIPPGGAPQPAPLGEDPIFVTLNFEIEAKLKAGSNPALCIEGQQVKGTYHSPAPGEKHACTQGLIHAGTCETDADCHTKKCVGGVRNGERCDDIIAQNLCALGQGTCQAQNDGKCQKFPFAGANRGDDGFSREYFPNHPEGKGLKVHSMVNKTISWFDGVGLQRSKRADVNFNADNEADFLAFVKGDAGTCQCHFKLKLDWDGTNKQFKAGTGIIKVDDAESKSCNTL